MVALYRLAVRSEIYYGIFRLNIKTKQKKITGVVFSQNYEATVIKNGDLL
jgi:hypothetical protein